MMLEQRFANVSKLIEELIEKYQTEVDNLSLSEKAKYGDSSTVSTYTWIHSMKAMNQKFISILMDIQSNIEREPFFNVPHWTSMEEQMPEDGKWAIWLDKNGRIQKARYKMDAIDHFFPEAPLFELEEAVAWMPLPTPLKEENE